MNYLIILTLIPLTVLAMGFAGIPLPFVTAGTLKRRDQEKTKNEAKQLLKALTANQDQLYPEKASGRTRIIPKVIQTTDTNNTIKNAP